MYHIKNDQRSIRSAELLYEGLASLMREKAFDSISVTDLVEAAQVGRATFYRHFDHIEDVLRLRCDQVFDGLTAYLLEYRQQHAHESRLLFLKPLLRYFYRQSDIIELLMMANRLDIVAAAFRRIFEPYRAQSAARFGLDAVYVDYGLAIRIGTVTSILIRWIETGKQQAPDELADKLGTMIQSMWMNDQLL